jgi:hypothetical protein
MILVWTTSDRKAQALGLAAQQQTHPRRGVQVRVRADERPSGRRARSTMK